VATGIVRGDVRLYSFAPPDKERPVVVLTRDSAIAYLSTVTVAPVTSTIRGVPSEVLLSEEDGMKEPCAVNLHNPVTVVQRKFGEARGTVKSPANASDLRSLTVLRGMRSGTLRIGSLKFQTRNFPIGDDSGIVVDSWIRSPRKRGPERRLSMVSGVTINDWKGLEPIILLA
jgi:mRNA interferase MazF